MNRLVRPTQFNLQNTFFYTVFIFIALHVLKTTSAFSLDGGNLRITTHNGWRAFEVITQGDNPSGDGVNYSMPGIFDGAGAWQVDSSTIRVLVNHETGDASISEVNLNLDSIQSAISNTITNGNTGGIRFVDSARQAYDRWSSNGGSSWTNTASASNTSFSRFCSGQAYAPNTFGQNRGFVDQIYITGEEVSRGRLFALDSVNRDLYQLTNVTGNAPGGIGGMPADSWENNALIDTGETNHIALMLSPDGGTEQMKIYIGVKGLDQNGNTSNSFLARNGLAYGSWYFLSSGLPSLGNTNNGSFETTSSGALSSSKFEDIDTNPNNPVQVVLGDQNSGVFRFDYTLVFGSSFDANGSSFTLTKISNESGSTNSLDSPDNLEWTFAATLDSTFYPDGIIYINEDNSSGEVWRMLPNGGSKLRIGNTRVSGESTGIFDLSEFVGYEPGSILITNNQGSPASMTVMINPEATPASGSNPTPTPTPIAGTSASVNFESGLNGWTQSSEDSHDWTINSGTTPSNNTGPSSAIEGSNYAYLETSSAGGGAFNAGNNAILTSPKLQSDNYEVSFSYHMLGNAIGSIYVDAFVNEQWQEDIWSRSGAQGSSWLSTQVLTPELTTQVRIRAVAAGSWQGDIAIDDISIIVNNGPVPTPTPIPTPGGSVIISEDNFDGGFGNWNDGGNDAGLHTGNNVINGSASVNLQDNSGNASSMIQDFFNASSFSEIEITFTYKPVSMENGEDFFVEFQDASGSWVIVEDYVRGVDFNNNQIITSSVAVNNNQFNFSGNVRFRIRCDASANRDDVFIDDVTVVGF